MSKQEEEITLGKRLQAIPLLKEMLKKGIDITKYPQEELSKDVEKIKEQIQKENEFYSDPNAHYHYLDIPYNFCKEFRNAEILNDAFMTSNFRMKISHFHDYLESHTHQINWDDGMITTSYSNKFNEEGNK